MLLLLKFHVSLQNIFLQESMIALHFLWLLKLKCACLIFFLFPAQVLWPYLLECLVPEPFTHAMNPLCRCICHLASKKREEQAEDFAIDFDAKGTRDTHSLILFSKRSFDNVVFFIEQKGGALCCFKFDERVSESDTLFLFIHNRKHTQTSCYNFTSTGEYKTV